MEPVILRRVPARFIVEWRERDGIVRTRTYSDGSAAARYVEQLRCRQEIERYRCELAASLGKVEFSAAEEIA